MERRDLHGGEARERPDRDGVAPPARITLGTQVYDALRDLLIAGELAPGERLSLRTVAERLGTSMMPAREAVSRLVADEALEVLPRLVDQVGIEAPLLVGHSDGASIALIHAAAAQRPPMVRTSVSAPQLRGRSGTA